ncbi:MAG: Leucine-rich repeat (LRR) protein [Crocinitomix sp.]|jgi:Leucine-rich repeat (LRR) protein
MVDLEFEDDYGTWVSQFEFPAIAEMKKKRNPIQEDSCHGHLEISIDNLVELPVSDLHLATIEYFNIHQHAIIKGLYQGAFEQREKLEDNYGFAREKGMAESFPILNSPEDLAFAIELNALHILYDTKDGLHYIALTGDCNWDSEHGFGVIMHKERLIDFGAWDVSSGGTIEVSRDNNTLSSDQIADEKKYTDRAKQYQQKLAVGKSDFLTDNEQLNERYSNLFDWLAHYRILSGYRYSFLEVPINEKIKVLENLFSLDLNYRDIETLHPDLNLLQNLKQLWINSIKITEIPAGICELKRLELFCADGCELNELPAELRQLNELKTLTLGWNNFLDFPEVIRSFTKLSSLRLERNKIKRIPDWIGELNQLESLDLEENQIKKLPKSISELIKLQDFRIRENRIPERRRKKLNDQFTAIPRFYC